MGKYALDVLVGVYHIQVWFQWLIVSIIKMLM